MSILDANAAGLHAANPPRCRSKKEDISGQAFDGKVFVNCSDDRLFRFRNNVVIRILWNCPARSDGR
jgi:hypothetical protein